jgi:hypothetical protein
MIEKLIKAPKDELQISFKLHYQPSIDHDAKLSFDRLSLQS